MIIILFAIFYVGKVGIVVVVFSNWLWLELVILDSVSFTVVIGKSEIEDWACMEVRFVKLVDPHKIKMARVKSAQNLNIALNICYKSIKRFIRLKPNQDLILNKDTYPIKI